MVFKLITRRFAAWCSVLPEDAPLCPWGGGGGGQKRDAGLLCRWGEDLLVESEERRPRFSVDSEVHKDPDAQHAARNDRTSGRLIDAAPHTQDPHTNEEEFTKNGKLEEKQSACRPF